MIVEPPAPVQGVTYFNVDSSSTWHPRDVMNRIGEALSARGFDDEDESDRYGRKSYKITVTVELA